MRKLTKSITKRITEAEFSLKQFYVVYFEDPSGTMGWKPTEAEQQLTPALCRGVGHLLSKDKKYIRLSLLCGSEDEVSMTLVIPTGCIKKMKRLYE